YIKQSQEGDKVFRLPLAIDIYTGTDKKRYNVWTENKTDTLVFSNASQPSLVNVDADKVLLWDKTDNKTADNFIFQFQHARNYMDRKEALDYFNKNGMKELELGLNDNYSDLRRSTIDRLAKSKLAQDAAIIGKIEKIADTDKDKKAKAAAIRFLAATKDAKYQALYNKYVGDSSYSVAAAALGGLSTLDPAKSYQLAKKYSSDAKGALGTVVNNAIINNGTESDFEFISGRYDEAPVSQAKLEMTSSFADYLAKLNDVAKIKKGIDQIIRFRGFIPQQYKNITDPAFKASFEKISKAKGEEIATYITEVFK
ncbi:MAG: hypothetical protein ABIN67_03920, partial [Ferruginibacter sp.]